MCNKKLLCLIAVTLLLLITFRSFAQTASANANPAGAVIIPPVDSTNMPIPIDPSRWYQLNNVSNGLDALFDGILNVNVNTGYGKLIDNYDAYYPVLPGENIDLYKIKMFSFQGNQYANPLTVSVIDSLGVRTPIATFVGGQYLTWVGPVPGKNTFALSKPMKDIKYIVINTWSQYPTEMQFYGNYTAPPDTTPVPKNHYPLNQYFGVNGFEWNFEDPNRTLTVNQPMLTAMESFTGFRHYMDWNKLESNQGSYTYNPVHSGSWNYDAIYRACLNNNITVLADLKTQPSWMVATYPANMQDSENVPVLYGKDVTDPNSYLEQAKMAFQYAARYGSNSSVNSNLLSVDPTTRWTNDPANKIKKGMSLVQYLECDNERDKWWKGRIAYQTSYEYAANLSAFYDGNKNTMGPGVGVKNADPNMQVVMGGLASADPTYVHGMIEWCKQHRGYKADGTVNICWDVINYHFYASDGVSGGIATTGVAPELSTALKTAVAFVKMSHTYAYDMPVWVTEAGYDNNQGSPQRAPAIGNKTPLQVEADWILRTSLLYTRAGIARLFYYEAYDDNPSNPVQYGSSGLLNADRSRKPAADYLYQVNKQFGNYSYRATQNSDPIVDFYQDNVQNSMYMLVIPDQKGRTKSYTLSLGLVDSACVYTPVIGANDMQATKVKLSSGKLTLNVTETPTFVVPMGLSDVPYLQKPTFLNKKKGKDSTAVAVNMYPNPSSKYVTVALTNKQTDKVTINITDINTSKVYSTGTYAKYSDNFANTIDISNVPAGVCIVQIIQGDTVTVRKLIKSN